MSIRQGLLALLAEREMYGAQLRSEFETRTGGTWPLNVGQVYTTLNRLERDGLVEAAGGPDEDGRIAYRLTPQGQEEVGRWWVTPVDRTEHPRDELTIKLALAVTVPGVDVPAVVQSQRTQTLRSLQDLTRLKQRASDADDIAWLLGIKPVTVDHHHRRAQANLREALGMPPLPRQTRRANRPRSQGPHHNEETA